MIDIKYKKMFLDELSKIPKEYRIKIEELVFNTIPNNDIKDFLLIINKMKGYDCFYKIRVGKYRIGLYYNDNQIEFQRVRHRKDIYKYFP